MTIFKTLIINYSDSWYAKASLEFIMQCLEGTEELREDNIIYFEDIRQEFDENNIKNEMANFIELHILYWLGRNKLYEKTERKYDELIANFSDESYINELKLRKAIFYIYEKKEPDKAVPLLQYVVNNKNHFSCLAQDELNYLANPPQPSSGSNDAATYTLSDNFPNPFNPITKIKFHLPQSDFVRLSIFNLMGQKVRELLHDNFSPGIYETTWDGRDEFGNQVSSGVYIYLINTNHFHQSKKLIAIK